MSDLSRKRSASVAGLPSLESLDPRPLKRLRLDDGTGIGTRFNSPTSEPMSMEVGSFQRASPEELATRRILRVKRRIQPPLGTFAPLTVPSYARAQHQVAQWDIKQPIMELRGDKATRKPQGSDFAALIQQRSDHIVTHTKMVEPKSLSLDDFGKFSGTSAKVKKHGVDLFHGLKGANQSGLYPSQVSMLHEQLPSHIDYVGARAAQMLSDLSEVMLHGATQAGKEPVEIQFGYGIKGGKLSVFASANQKESQDWLASALAQSPGEHFKAAALHTSDPELSLIGTKLLFHEEQQQQRRTAPRAPGKGESSSDMALADAIRAKFLAGDVTVVKNPRGRHAEQNIGVALHQGKYEFADIQGTKIRCHACRNALGVNTRSDTGIGLSGKVYASQEAPGRFQHSFTEISQGKEKIVTQQPQRPRSLSFSSLPAYKPPASTHSQSQTGGGL